MLWHASSMQARRGRLSKVEKKRSVHAQQLGIHKPHCFACVTHIITTTTHALTHSLTSYYSA